jgi:hypothetical protein
VGGRIIDSCTAYCCAVPAARLAARFVVPSSEVSLARIWGLGARLVGKFTVAESILRQSSADDDMDKLLFWLGLGAAHKGAGSKPIRRRHWAVSLVVGVLVAALIGVGMFLLLVSQKL